MTGGTLGALVDTHNRVLASLLGDATQPGQLNQMAQAIADRVNQLLAAGSISDGPPPVAGVALFSYDTSNATNVASSLALDPSVTPDQLAAIDPGPPYVSNGTALKLAGLENSQNPADRINNLNYEQYYGTVAAGVGRELSAAQDRQDVQKQLVAQAQAFQQQTSGVSLDAEAVKMIQFQRSYQANARFVAVLDSLTQTAVNLIPT
jgi:flagellar hook-associated protein 1